MSSWLPQSWSSGSPEPRKASQISRDEVEHVADDIAKNAIDFVASLYARAAALPPPLLILSAFALGGTTALSANYVYTRNFRRIANGEWVTPQMLARRRWVKGYVTSVGDADNFRLYHTPGIGWRWPMKFRNIPVGRTDLKDQTIHIRLAGVDAPEAGHFGRPAQPFADESLAWLKSQVEGKFIYCQLVRKDQFGRIVSAVNLKPRILPGWLTSGRDVSLEMLRAGWASVYEQAGAEYGRSGLQEFLRVQSEAQRAKKGIWKHGTRGETPAEYKKRYRDAAASGEPIAELLSTTGKGSTSSQDTSGGGWLRRLFWLGSKQ